MKTDMAIETDYQFFNPVTYLKQYFHSMDAENEQLLQFFHHVAGNHNLHGASIMDFGCGPTIFAMISFCRDCAEIHMSDYLERNLQQVRWWLEEADQCFNWDPFVHYVLELEARAELEETTGNGTVAVPAAAVAARAALLRQKVTRLLPGNARAAHPVGPEGFSRYDVLVSSFCLAEVAQDIQEWQTLLANITTMLKPGGLLVLNTVLDSIAYGVGADYFAMCNITKQTLLDTLVQTGYEASSIETHDVAATVPELMYQGFTMLTARKRPD
jgi:nicotinamide N-methyltransferase/methyltransferase